MPPDDETVPAPGVPEDSRAIEILPARIDGEKTPERLLSLARELQQALNERKSQLAEIPHKVDPIQ